MAPNAPRDYGPIPYRRPGPQIISHLPKHVGHQEHKHCDVILLAVLEIHHEAVVGVAELGGLGERLVYDDVVLAEHVLSAMERKVFVIVMARAGESTKDPRMWEDSSQRVVNLDFLEQWFLTFSVTPPS